MSNNRQSSDIEWGGYALKSEMPVAKDTNGNIEDLANQSTKRVQPQWPAYLMGQEGRPARVSLVTPDEHISQVIAQELMTDVRTDMVGQATGVRDGRRLINSRETDVLMVDLHLSDGTGFQMIEYVRQTRPMIEVIVVTSCDDEDHALRAFRSGANGYLLKNSWFGSYADAVLQVVNGGAAVTPGLLRHLVRRLRTPVGIEAMLGSGQRDTLSEREKDVLRMLAKGQTSAQVALNLVIGEQTVNTHVRSIYRKLNVHTRAQAVATASNFGIL